MATSGINRLFGVDTAEAGTPAASVAEAAETAANHAAREKLYADTRGASYDFNKSKLDLDRDTSERNLRFALARSGMFGSSVDVDQHALQQRAYDTGFLDIGNNADAGVADLRSSDENARLGLISQINAGVDAGSALSSGREQLSVNADRANSRFSATENALMHPGPFPHEARTATWFTRTPGPSRPDCRPSPSRHPPTDHSTKH